MLMRFDPFRELDRLSHDLWGRDRRTWMPMDAYRRGDQLVAHFDLPGVERDSIDITVEKDVLTVKAERTWRPGEGEHVVVSERPRGSFTRRLFLGESLDADRIEARYDDGVLTLTVPLVEQAKARKVHVTGAGQPEAVETESAAA